MANNVREILELFLRVTGQESADALGEALKKIGTDAASSDEELQSLTKELDRLSDAADKAAKFSELSAKLLKTEEAIQRTKEQIEALRVEAEQSGGTNTELAAKYDTLNKELGKLYATQVRQQRALEDSSRELRAAGIDSTQLATAQDRLQRETEQTTAAFAAQASRLAYAREAAERNAAAFRAIGTAFKNIGSQAVDLSRQLQVVGTVAATAAASFAAFKVGQFFNDAIDSATQFEGALKEVQAVSGATDAQLQQLRETAKQAGLESGFSFTEAAQGLGELARATGDAETAIATLPPVLNLARAGGLEVAKAAEITTTTLTQFGLAAEEAGRVSDVLAQGANSSTASVEQLGNSLSYAAPLARQLGASLEDTVAIIAALADEGFRGERAGTALRNVFSALANPTSKFSKALDEAGIKTRDFGDVIAALGARADKGREILLALDAEARPAILALTEKGGASIRKFEQDLTNAGGAAQRTAQVIQQSLGASFTRVANQFDNLRLELIDPLLEPLQQELDGLARKLSELAQSPEFATISQALRDIFVAGIDAAKEFSGSLDFADIAARISEFAKTAGDDFRQIVVEVKALADVLSQAATAVGVLFDGVQALTLGIAALAAKVTEVANSILAFQTRTLNAIPAVNLLAKAVGVDLPAAAKEADIRAGGLGAVFTEFADRALKNIDELTEGFKKFAGAAEAGGGQAAAGFNAAGTAAENAEQKIRDASAAAADFDASFQGSADNVDFNAQVIETALEGPSLKLQELVARSAALTRQLEEGIKTGKPQAELDALRVQLDAVNVELSQVEKEVNKTATSFANLGNQADNTRKQLGGGTSGTFEQVTAGLELVRRAADATAFSLGAVSDAAAKAFVSMNKYASQQRVWAERMNSLTQALRQQRDAAELRLKQIEQELALSDPLIQSIEALRAQYGGLLDDATLERLARGEAELAKLREESERASAAVAEERSQRQQNATEQQQRGSAFQDVSSGGGSAGGLASVNVTVNGSIVGTSPDKLADELYKLAEEGRRRAGIRRG